MNNLTKSILAILLVTLFSTVSFADDFPTIKSGYWETTSSDGSKFKHCVDSKSLKDLFKKSSKMMQGTCKEMKIEKKGSIFISRAVCKILASTMTVVSEISGDFNKEYVSKSVTEFKPALMGKTKETSTEKSKLISESCPKGMKPGDVEMENGTTINTNKMIENMPNLNDLNKVMEGMNSGQMPDADQMEKMRKMMEEMQKNMGQ